MTNVWHSMTILIRDINRLDQGMWDHLLFSNMTDWLVTDYILLLLHWLRLIFFIPEVPLTWTGWATGRFWRTTTLATAGGSCRSATLMFSTKVLVKDSPDKYQYQYYCLCRLSHWSEGGGKQCQSYHGEQISDGRHWRRVRTMLKPQLAGCWVLTVELEF